MGFEEESERKPLTPEQEAALLDLIASRAPAALAEYERAENAEDRFYALPDAAFAAFHLKQMALSSQLASELLVMAPQFEGNWNFGNAIHAGHTVQGLLALHEGETQRAIHELHCAGGTPGSPQLDSFGPTMLLARALLRTGQAAAVMQYFAQCRKFWKMGGTWLDIWEAKVRAGQVPNFFMNLR